MKDLDFDEIDRAVNSVSSSPPTGNDNTDTSAQDSDSQLTVPKRPSQTLAGRRSSGQFMDVVHPSSDMRRSPLIAHERAPVQNTITNDSSTEPVTPVTPVVHVAPVSPSDSTPPPEPASSNNTWPDPIDFHGSNKDVQENVKETNQDQDEDADIDRISDDITNELSKKSNESLDSPFISGAKVEKRPLGAFSTEPTAQLQSAEPADQNVTPGKEDSGKEVKPTNTDNTDTSLPEELQDDLLHIESGNSSTSSDDTSDDTPIDTETGIKTDTKTDAKTKAPVVSADVPVVGTQTSAPTSITQQYKEQPSTGDQSTGAIYNTDAYHKTPVRPSKKKPGWMWIVWIIILIVVGVGAGVAVYNYVLPLL